MNKNLTVPFNDLHKNYVSLKSDIDLAIQEVINKSQFINGPQLQKFEKKFAQFCQIKYAAGCANGTAALHLALLACRIKPGDEVITTPMSFIATTEAITYVGAGIKFVDIDPKTYTLDVNKIEQAITKKTKAIIPVHLYGQSADMNPILEIAKANGLAVIEDAAQAHGALYKEHPVGSIGDVGCFSFYPGKNLGAFGDAGAVVTNSKEKSDFMRLLANHGRKDKYDHVIEGYNYRLDSIHAAVLGVKLKYLPHWIKKRQEIARQYSEALSALPIITPKIVDGNNHVFHLYVIMTKKRNELKEFLAGKGVQALVHYPTPIHLLKAYRHLEHKTGDFPVAERLGEQALSLPIYPEMSEPQIQKVIDCITLFFKQ